MTIPVNSVFSETIGEIGKAKCTIKWSTWHAANLLCVLDPFNTLLDSLEKGTWIRGGLKMHKLP